MNLQRPIAPNPYDHLPQLPSMTLVSEDVAEGAPLAQAQAYDGGNTSPQLSWDGVPEGTKSFVVTCFDPDAPTPSGFWHWVLVGLPADTRSLPAGAGSADATLPGTAYMLRNDYGSNDFGGAAPPPGDHPHRYIFAVYAVDTDDFGIGPSASCAAAHFMMLGHQLARGTLTGTYQR